MEGIGSWLMLQTQRGMDEVHCLLGQNFAESHERVVRFALYSYMTKIKYSAIILDAT